MATVSLAAFSAALSLIFMDRTTVQFRRDVVLPNLLAVKRDRNKTCTWNVKFDGRSAGGAYAEGADMADGDYDAHTRATASLNWAQYRKGAKVSGLAQAVAAASGGSGAGDVSDIFLTEVEDAVHDLANDVSSHSYAGDPTASPTQLAGAAVAIDGTAGTFAGLASATYSDWLSAENTLATAQLSEEKLRTLLHRPVRDATGHDPDFVTCNGTLFDRVRGLASERSDAVTTMVRGANGMVDIEKMMGARAVRVDGVPYIEDRHATASTFYAWSARHVEYRQVPAANSSVSPNEVQQAVFNLTGVQVPLNEVEQGLRTMFGGGQIVPFIKLLGATGDSMKAMVHVYAQLAWKSRNGFAKLALV